MCKRACVATKFITVSKEQLASGTYLINWPVRVLHRVQTASLNPIFHQSRLKSNGFFVEAESDLDRFVSVWTDLNTQIWFFVCPWRHSLRRHYNSNLSVWGSILGPILNRAGSHLDSCLPCGQSAQKIGSLKQSDLNQIRLRSECRHTDTFKDGGDVCFRDATRLLMHSHGLPASLPMLTFDPWHQQDKILVYLQSTKHSERPAACLAPTTMFTSLKVVIAYCILSIHFWPLSLFFFFLFTPVAPPHCFNRIRVTLSHPLCCFSLLTCHQTLLPFSVYEIHFRLNARHRKLRRLRRGPMPVSS